MPQILNVISAAESVDDYELENGSNSVIESDREEQRIDVSRNHGSQLIDATCVPADIR